ncbi:MAG: hypothetical protein ACE5EN_01285 [Nitrospinota bacterium]
MIELHSDTASVASGNYEPINTFEEIGDGTALTIIKETEKVKWRFLFGNELLKASDLPARTLSLYEEKRQKSDAIILHLEQLLYASPFLKEWGENGLSKPTPLCKKRTLNIAGKIFSKHNLLPTRVAPSVEEGIMLVYLDNSKSCSLKIEVYNTLEIAGLINKDKEIVRSIDVTSDQDIEKLVHDYKNL